MSGRVGATQHLASGGVVPIRLTNPNATPQTIEDDKDDIHGDVFSYSGGIVITVLAHGGL